MTRSGSGSPSLLILVVAELVKSFGRRYPIAESLVTQLHVELRASRRPS
jgi:hypothetical protein